MRNLTSRFRRDKPVASATSFTVMSRDRLRIDVDQSLSWVTEGRFAREVEVAAYYVIAEGLTNVAIGRRLADHRVRSSVAPSCRMSEQVVTSYAYAMPE